MLNETSHANSASGLPGGPKRTDGNVNVKISAEVVGDAERWETESTESQTKIKKTTVMCAEWEERESGDKGRGRDEIEVVGKRKG